MFNRFNRFSGNISRSFARQVLIDFVLICFHLLVSVYFVYFSKPLYRDVFFLIPLILFWYSKKNYFWFAYFFILLNEPGWFFFTTSIKELHRLPYYTVLPSMSFTLIDLFVILALVKAIIKGKRKSFVFSKPLRLLLVYFVLFSLPLTLLFKTDLASFANSLRSLTYYSVIVSFYWLARDEREVYAFGYLLVPCLAVVIANQFYLMFTGDYLISLVSAEVSTNVIRNSVSGEIRPVMRAVLIVFSCLFFGMLLSKSKEYEIFRGLGEMIILIAAASFFLSATRSWISITLLSLTSFFFMSTRRTGLIARFSLIVGVSLAILINLRVISLDYFERNIWERYVPVARALLHGSLSGTDTFVNRVETDLPKTVSGLKMSPIVGVGLSTEFTEHYSNDLGFLNTILLFGTAGFVLFLHFLFSFYARLRICSKFTHSKPNSQHIFVALRAISLGVFLGYCLTWDFFSFYAYKVYFIALLIAFAELTLHDFREERNTNVLRPHQPQLVRGY